jgi:hypothetical protein
MFNNSLLRYTLITVITFVISRQTAWPGTAAIYCDVESPRVQFAVGDLQSALNRRGFTVGIKPLDAPQSAELNFIVAVESSVRKSSDAELKPEGYRIEVEGNTYRALGKDDAGAMYGGLEVADLLRLGLPIENEKRAPFILKRGVKFNIPRDARTPSYDDTGDPAQDNIGTVWHFEFWKVFLDDLRAIGTTC